MMTQTDGGVQREGVLLWSFPLTNNKNNKNTINIIMNELLFLDISEALDVL